MIADNNVMTLGQRIKILMIDRGITLQSMGDTCGVSRGAVSNWHRTSKIDKYNLEKVALRLGVNEKELLHGIDSASEPSRYAVAVKHTPDSFAIPQYNTGGKMGNGLVLRDQAGVIRGWEVNNEWVQKNIPHCTAPKNLALVTGFGDSMLGIFNSGDPLIVDRGVTSCDYDGIYFFRVGNEGYIKRLQRIPAVGIRVISENKSYEAWTITPEMDFEVFAKVLKAWRGESY
jgi:transcriptional regulator with XRE-family HTH domain